MRQISGHSRSALRSAVCSAVLAGVLVGVGAGPAGAEPVTPPPSAGAGRALLSESRLEAVRERVDVLYRQAGTATDRYNAAHELAGKQRRAVARLSRAVAAKRNAVERLRGAAGGLARMQYRAQVLPPAAELMLSDDPADWLAERPAYHSGGRSVATMLTVLATAERELSGRQRAERIALGRLAAAERKGAAAKSAIERRLEEATRLLDGLRKAELKRLEQLEARAAGRANSAFLASLPGGGLSKGGASSGAARAAMAFAAAQLGKWYEWGAEGPDTFDCSGLTQSAWASVGVRIPRTSQEQWSRLRRIPVGAMRPGDLVIFHRDASHVGIYIGEGRIIHAPRPGRRITVAPVGLNPVLGVVRVPGR